MLRNLGCGRSAGVFLNCFLLSPSEQIYCGRDAVVILA
jgi:hypothetical protein